ncbi:MAG: hypothetical protein WA061_06235 [Microgenomates group bacterium]
MAKLIWWIMKFGGTQSNSNMKIILRIALIAFVALGASLGLWMYLNGYLTKSKASNGVATLSFAQPSVTAKGGDIVHGDLTITTLSGMSGIDISFTTEGTNLSFLYTNTSAHLPAGFELILDEIGMTDQNANTSQKGLKRMILVSKNSSAQLPKTALIPLYFSVVNNGQAAATTTLKVITSVSQIVGVSDSNTSGTVFSLEPNVSPLAFTVQVEDPRAASVTNLTCSSSCGSNVKLRWTDSANEDGYKVYKDGALLETIGSNTTNYIHSWCNNYINHTYAIIAYNSKGSVSTTQPNIACACTVCPTQAPPTPTPIMPTNSADLIFRLNFPDVDMNVNTVSNVKVMVMDNDGKKVCNDDTNCAQIVSFNRMYTANGPTTYFSSPQLQFNLTENRAYSIVVKQNHTVQRTYKNVFLIWKTLLNCLVPNPSVNHGCGQLISADLESRPMLGGDMDGLDSTLPGFNIINIDDREKVGKIADSQATLQQKTAEGDMNLDGGTDVKDLGIVEKNFNRKGD